jgi:hypothetical protein
MNAGESVFQRYTKKIDNHAFRAEYEKTDIKKFLEIDMTRRIIEGLIKKT